MDRDRPRYEYYQSLREHPLSAAWRGVADDFNHRFRVSVCEGMVIDGRAKITTSIASTRPPLLIGLGGLDPVAFILDKYQWVDASSAKTEAVAKCSLWLPPGRPAKSRVRAVQEGLLSLMTAEEMAEMAGVSIRTVVRMKSEIRVARDAEARDMTLPEAKRRIAELEAELEDHRMIIQDMANRAMPETEQTEALKMAARSNRALRGRLRSETVRARSTKRTATLLERQLKRAKRR